MAENTLSNNIHNNIWIQTDDSNGYFFNEIKQVPSSELEEKFSELRLYGVVVMTYDTYVRLIYGSGMHYDEFDENGDLKEHDERVQAFCDDIATLFQKIIPDKFINKENCILHVDLVDEMVASVSIQHPTDYYFFVKDYWIPLKE